MKIILLLVNVAFRGEGMLGKIFGDEACRQARLCRKVAVVDSGNEGELDRAEGCSVKVLGIGLSGLSMTWRSWSWFL